MDWFIYIWIGICFFMIISMGILCYKRKKDMQEMRKSMEEIDGKINSLEAELNDELSKLLNTIKSKTEDNSNRK